MPARKTTGNSSPFALCMREQRYLRGAVDAVGIGNQSGMIQEIGQRFAALGGIGRGVDQFDQVARARLGFGIRVLLEHPLVSGAIEHKPDQLIDRRFAASAFSSSIIVLKALSAASARVGKARSSSSLPIAPQTLS